MGVRRVFELLEPLRRDAVGVGERCDVRPGDGFQQDLLPLAVEVTGEDADAGRIAAGLRQRGHKTRSDQIFRYGKNRNDFCRLLRGTHIRVPGANDSRSDRREGFAPR